MARRTAFVVSLLFLASACGEAARTPSALPPARRLAVESDAGNRLRPPNYNALQDRGLARAAGTPAPGLVHLDDRLGVPTFRWGRLAPPDAVAASSRALVSRRTAVEQARAHLGAGAARYGLSSSEVEQAEVSEVHDTGSGALIVRFRQRLAGVEVFRGDTAVAMDRMFNLVAQSGSLVPAGDLPEGAAFALDASEAVARAVTDLDGEAYAPGDLRVGGSQGDYRTFALAPQTSRARNVVFSRPARARRVWFRLPGALEPAWYVEVGLGRPGGRDSLQYGYVFSARDGRLLFRKDQVQDAFTYRVYADAAGDHFPYDGPQGFAGSPHPTGQRDGFAPPNVPQVDVTLDHGPISTGDPWLPAGATQTTGNNVDAYADVADPDGFSGGDLRASTTAAGAFLHTFSPDTAPGGLSNRRAAVTQLFYVNNWLHDWYYDAGFDEASGNGQASNLGRGGLGGDRLLAEAQDFGGLDNANMATPADGGSPRMQMYLWAAPTAQYLQVNAPAALQQSVPAGVSFEFGPQSFDLTGDVVPVVDGTAPAGDGCGALTNGAAVAGKIALVDRGSCSFVVKARNAQDAGAVGVIVRNVSASQTLVNMASDGTPAAASLTVPVQLVGLDPGKTIGDAITAGDAVNVRMKRNASQLRDGDLDTSIVAHEWGHYISNRLVGDASGLDTNMAGGLGEGWSDFHALLLVVREEDAAVPANAGWAGVYGVGAYASGGDYPLGGPNDSYYWAIRRVPYSTDFNRNPLTFRHIADGQALPTEVSGTPVEIQFGQSGASNSEVHNTGEVWATMLWECYAALLGDSGRLTFAEAQDRMKRYLVASYKLVPVSPTLLEARDALLAAAYAGDPADFALFFEAFARRGAGIGAVGPDRYAPDNVGVVESYLSGPELSPGEAVVNVTSVACNDADPVLDNGETATVTVQLQNVGTLALGATTVTLSSPDPRLSFPAGGTAAVAATGVFGSAQLSFQIALQGAARAEVLPVEVTFPAGYLRTDAPRTFSLRVNYDDRAAAATTDTFESSQLAWTAQNDAGLSQAATWGRIAVDPAQHLVRGPDLSAPSDVRLVSPPLAVGGSAFRVSFRQRHQFEGDAASSTYFDGGVLELSQDDGATWVDVGGQARIGTDPAYGPASLAAAGSANPLAGRMAFVGKSPGYPEFSTVTLDLGTTYAGRTVRLRFRIGTDDFVGGAGWELDDVALTGVTGLPFPGLVFDELVCGTGGAVASAGPPQRVAERSPVALDGSASTAEDPSVGLTYAWSQTAGPAVTLAGDTTAIATFTAPEVADDTPLTFELTVSDGAVVDTATTTVTVANVNRAPVSVPGASRTVDENTLVALDGSGSFDPDPGATLTFRWQQVSGRPVVLADADTATASFTAPEVTGDATLQFRLTVSDGQLSGSAALNVIVHDLTAGGGGGGGGGGCGSAGAAGPLALLGLAALLRRRRR